MAAIIPARYASTRLPGKLLLPITGKPLVVHTIEQTLKSSLVDKVIVATDDGRVADAVRTAGFEAIMTSVEHCSGSDRVAEVAETLPTGSIIVNVQGDEPLISPSTIDAAISAMLETADRDVVTTCEKIDNAVDVLSSDVVKVVMNRDGDALYFSRSAIPFPREAASRHGGLELALGAEPGLLRNFRKHTGLYVYRREFLLKFCRMPQTILEHTEMLEQLRALENGVKIRVVEVTNRSIGVDTAEDLERVRRIIENNG